MATMPPWAIGRDVSSVVATPQSVNASTGAMSDTTPVQTLYGHLDGIEVVSRLTTENLSPMNSLQENQVYIETGTEYRFTEFEKNVTAGSNAGGLLANAAYGAFSIYKLVITRSGKTWTGYGLLGEYTSRMQKNRIMGECRFLPIDINGTSGSGSANPVYS